MSAVEEYHRFWESGEDVKCRDCHAKADAALAELEAERDALRLVNEKQSEKITDLKASEEWYKADLEGTTAKMEFQARRADKAEAKRDEAWDYAREKNRILCGIGCDAPILCSRAPSCDECDHYLPVKLQRSEAEAKQTYAERLLRETARTDKAEARFRAERLLRQKAESALNEALRHPNAKPQRLVEYVYRIEQAAARHDTEVEP